MQYKRAVFLDRDGTIIKDKGYIGDITKVTFFPFAFDALLKIQQFFMLFIVTNQAGIAKGIVTHDEVTAVNSYIVRVLSNKGIKIQALYCCPHKKEDDCKCRKPKPYFIEQAISKYKIDSSKSFVVGDHPSDVMLAQNAGMQGIYVLTGHGQKHRGEINNNVIVKKNLHYAVDYILKSVNTQ
ncbi:MAG: HAD family hydrolase [Spirochaetes bacterium]|nr:HAD family hydrolase [Spirochaetota bacterium]